MNADRRSRTEPEGGFTLLELLVVVAVLGVLLAMAVPMLVAAQGGAKAKAAQSNARSALSAAKALVTEHENYWVTSDAATFQLLHSAEPSLGWVASMGSPSGRADEVSWASGTSQVVLAVRAATGECFFVRDNIDRASADFGTSYGKTVDTDASTCDADGAAPVWKRNQAEGWPKSGPSA